MKNHIDENTYHNLGLCDECNKPVKTKNAIFVPPYSKLMHMECYKKLNNL